MARILIVDDSIEVLNLARLYLSNENHEVLTATSAMSAMEVLNTYRVDLGIFDIEMPYTNGFQLAQTLKNSLRYKFFPIIFLTARKEKSDVERAMKIKADGYVLKPIVKDKLIEAVNFVTKKIPPAQTPNIDIKKTVISENAQVIKKESMLLKQISDIGVVVISKSKFNLDDVVELNSNLFHEIGIPPVPFKVVHVKEVESTLWEVKLVFLGLNYESVQRLRAWILAQDLNTAAS